jgi:murein DD-endopeptidase MepM/ murein hydrolase activator NlpD
MSSADGDRAARTVSILVVPENGRATWTLRLTYRRLRLLAGIGGAAALALALMAGSWWYFAARAAKAAQLEARVAELELERSRIVALAEELRELEAAYDRLRAMFGPETGGASGLLWLPPPAGRGSRPPGTDSGGVPSSWPLTEPGFVTQGLLAGGGSDHPGVDIAVPSGTYVRAAGAAVVSEAAEDEVYGLFVVLDHGNGYRTVYGHASALMVTVGDSVRGNEVIALSGSTGRSTAPHLHFEVLRDGEPLDPLTVVRTP